jgi:hypothetical protein
MAKGKTKQLVVPKFSSESEEAAWWDSHRPEIDSEIRERVRTGPLTLGNLVRGAKPSQPVTLRVSHEDLETARRLAARRGLGYQTYIKMLLRNALGEDSAEGVVDDFCSYAEVETGFRYWSNAEFLSSETQLAIQTSDIVLVPAEGFGDYVEPVFPKGTDDLFQFLRTSAPHGVKVELAMEDAGYKELALHADTLHLATVLVSLLVAPVAVGLIVEYLKKRLGSRLGKMEVRASMILDQTDGPDGKALRISYEGPANAFARTMREALSVISGTKTAHPEISGGKVIHRRRTTENDY